MHDTVFSPFPQTAYDWTFSLVKTYPVHEVSAVTFGRIVGVEFEIITSDDVGGAGRGRRRRRIRIIEPIFAVRPIASLSRQHDTRIRWTTLYRLLEQMLRTVWRHRRRWNRCRRRRRTCRSGVVAAASVIRVTVLLFFISTRLLGREKVGKYLIELHLIRSTGKFEKNGRFSVSLFCESIIRTIKWLQLLYWTYEYISLRYTIMWIRMSGRIFSQFCPVM